MYVHTETRVETDFEVNVEGGDSVKLIWAQGSGRVLEKKKNPKSRSVATGTFTLH